MERLKLLDGLLADVKKELEETPSAKRYLPYTCFDIKRCEVLDYDVGAYARYNEDTDTFSFFSLFFNRNIDDMKETLKHEEAHRVLYAMNPRFLHRISKRQERLYVLAYRKAGKDAVREIKPGEDILNTGNKTRTALMQKLLAEEHGPEWFAVYTSLGGVPSVYPDGTPAFGPGSKYWALRFVPLGDFEEFDRAWRGARDENGLYHPGRNSYPYGKTPCLG